MPSSFFSGRYRSSPNPFGSSSSVRRTASPYNSDEEQDDYPYPPYGSRAPRQSTLGGGGGGGGYYGSSHGRSIDRYGRGSLYALEGPPRSTPSIRIPTQETRYGDHNDRDVSPLRRARNRARGYASSETETVDDQHYSDDVTLVNRPIRGYNQYAPRPFGQVVYGPFGGQSAAPFGQRAAVPFGFQGAGPFGSQGAVPFGSQGAVPFGFQGGRQYGAMDSGPSRAAPIRHSSPVNRNPGRASSSHECTLWDCDHPGESSSGRSSRNPFGNWGSGFSSRRW